MHNNSLIFGAHDLNNGAEDYRQVVQVSKVVKHEKYSGTR